LISSDSSKLIPESAGFDEYREAMMPPWAEALA
jgi:hypothetical protein